jgi:hypothetical protein
VGIGLQRRLLWWGTGAAALTLCTGGGAAVSASSPSTARISPDEAIALAATDLARAADGFRLRTPTLRASFTASGLRVKARHGPDWRWRLTHAGAAGVDEGPVPPTAQGRLAIDYRRGAMIERYRVKSAGVEQQFVLPGPLRLAGDLVVAGRIDSTGRFERAGKGWRWRDQQGAVTLGDVTVFDARARKLPARMHVTAEATRIVVDGNALAHAAYPITIDPEIGANDFPISQFSALANRDASQAAVAYNPTDDEYLVVWRGDGLATDDEVEIFGQRLDATTGAEVGTNDFRISDMGPDGSTLFAAANPAVAYNIERGQYVVVWRGDDNTPPLVDEEFEIFGQRLSAAGVPTGTNDFRISDMGPDGTPAFGAFTPAVTWMSPHNDYLVVWQGDDGTAPLVDGEFEIYGQRLSGSAGPIGANDFRISDMGPDGNASFDASRPSVVANDGSEEYLVVWDGDDDTPPLAESDNEIFGQRLSALGAPLGTNDFRISDMGPDGSTLFDASDPAVAHNSTSNEYLVVWNGDDDTAPLVDEEFEIFGQLLNAAGAELGANDFRISDMGPDANTSFTAVEPAVAYNPASGDYLVAWRGDDGTAPLVDNEFEIFGQRLKPTGSPTGTNDFRISDMGPDGSPAFDPAQPAVTGNGGPEYLVVWQSDDDTPPRVDNAVEIFGQRHAPDPPTAARTLAFAARRTDAGISVRWRTASEAGVLGFNLWRGGTRVNQQLITAKASGTTRGARYSLLDRSARSGAPYVYRLELVLLGGGRISESLRVK